MSIIDAQDAELRRTCEIPLARKLGLGSNFSRKIMCGRVTAMRIGIVATKIEIASLTLKLCLSYKIMDSENGKFLKIIENNQTI